MENNNKSVDVISALEKYYPFHLSAKDLFEEVDEITASVSAAPMKMLLTILKMDLEGRNCLEYLEHKTNAGGPDEDLTKNTELGYRRRRRRPENKESTLLSPQDLLMVAFQTCDPYLQQILAEKMFQGKLAVPFLLPSPIKDKTNILTCWPFRSTILEWKDKEIEILSFFTR